MQKKVEELENKLKEKETRIGQMNNVINASKAKIQAHQKTITDLTKEVNDIKASQQSSATPAVATIDTTLVQKSDFEAIKSKLLQTHIDNEKLKKELFEANCKLTSNQLGLAGNTANANVSNFSTSPKQASATTASIASQVCAVEKLKKMFDLNYFRFKFVFS